MIFSPIINAENSFLKGCPMPYALFYARVDLFICLEFLLFSLTSTLYHDSSILLGQSKAKAEKNQAMEHSMSENSCQLCAVEKLTFEPPPIYCTTCGARIKRNAMYYTMGAGDARHYFCIPCYNEARGDTIIVDGTAIPKPRLEKKKNDEETEEWVCYVFAFLLLNWQLSVFH